MKKQLTCLPDFPFKRRGGGDGGGIKKQLNEREGNEPLEGLPLDVVVTNVFDDLLLRAARVPNLGMREREENKKIPER